MTSIRLAPDSIYHNFAAPKVHACLLSIPSILTSLKAEQEMIINPIFKGRMIHKKLIEKLVRTLAKTYDGQITSNVQLLRAFKRWFSLYSYYTTMSAYWNSSPAD